MAVCPLLVELGLPGETPGYVRLSEGLEAHNDTRCSPNPTPTPEIMDPFFFSLVSPPRFIYLGIMSQTVSSRDISSSVAVASEMDTSSLL